jgi:hypothetical protein
MDQQIFSIKSKNRNVLGFSDHVPSTPSLKYEYTMHDTEATVPALQKQL